MRSLVVLPTYNERQNIGPLISSILAQGPGYDVLIIDDGSPDGTGALADVLKDTHRGRLAVIHRQDKLGLATAYLTGFRYGLTRGYDYVFEMDADFSHNPACLPTFLAVMERESADVVLGSRYVEGGGVVRWPWYRKLMSRGGSLYAARMLGVDVRDLTGGFKCFRREVLERMDFESLTSSGYGFQIELTYRAIEAGFVVVEMPIIFEERQAGESKMSPAIFWEALWLVAKMRSERRRKAARADTERSH